MINTILHLTSWVKIHASNMLAYTKLLQILAEWFVSTPSSSMSVLSNIYWNSACSFKTDGLLLFV